MKVVAMLRYPIAVEIEHADAAFKVEIKNDRVRLFRKDKRAAWRCILSCASDEAKTALYALEFAVGAEGRKPAEKVRA